MFSSGFKCLIYSDSRIGRSLLSLALCRILKSSMLKGWCVFSQCFRMAEELGLEIGRAVLAEQPLCSAYLRVRFLSVSPTYLTLQLEQLNW